MLNVVATMDTPMSHHGAERPDAKNSVLLLPARRARNTAGRKEMMIEMATTVQSREVSCTNQPVEVTPAQAPRVKSGKRIGALPWATESSLNGPGALHAAASYTSKSGARPSRMH